MGGPERTRRRGAGAPERAPVHYRHGSSKGRRPGGAVTRAGLRLRHRRPASRRRAQRRRSGSGGTAGGGPDLPCRAGFYELAQLPARRPAHPGAQGWGRADPAPRALSRPEEDGPLTRGGRGRRADEPVAYEQAPARSHLRAEGARRGRSPPRERRGPATAPGPRRPRRNAASPPLRPSMIPFETLILGTRGSRLALTQAEACAKQLHVAGLSVEIRAIKTISDPHPDTPLSVIDRRDVFTRQLDEALMKGEIDLAVHSLKDVPTEPPGIGRAHV